MKNFTKKASVLGFCLIFLLGVFASVGFTTVPAKVTPDTGAEDIPNIDDPDIPSDDNKENPDTPSGGDSDSGNTEQPDIDIPERFRSALQAYNYAMKYLNNSYGVYTVSSGYTTASVATQEIKGYRKIDKDGNFITESTSKKTGSIGVNLAEKSYIPKNEDKIYYKHTSSVNDDLTANYTDDVETYTFDEYINKFYILPNATNYVINKDTITNSRIKYDSSNERYTGSFILNSDAVEVYKHKIKKSSGSSTMPVFKSVTLDFVLDKYGRFLMISTSEVCSATVVLNMTITTKVKEIFKCYNNEKITIDQGEF